MWSSFKFVLVTLQSGDTTTQKQSARGCGCGRGTETHSGGSDGSTMRPGVFYGGRVIKKADKIATDKASEQAQPAKPPKHPSKGNK